MLTGFSGFLIALGTICLVILGIVVSLTVLFVYVITQADDREEEPREGVPPRKWRAF